MLPRIDCKSRFGARAFSHQGPLGNWTICQLQPESWISSLPSNVHLRLSFLRKPIIVTSPNSAWLSPDQWGFPCWAHDLQTPTLHFCMDTTLYSGFSAADYCYCHYKPTQLVQADGHHPWAWFWFVFLTIYGSFPSCLRFLTISDWPLSLSVCSCIGSVGLCYVLSEVFWYAKYFDITSSWTGTSEKVELN